MKCAVYRLWTSSRGLLYVGCSPDPLACIASHEKRKPWASCISHATIEWFENKAEALAAEKLAIRGEEPEWNVHHRTNPKHAIGIFHPAYAPQDPSTWVRQ